MYIHIPVGDIHTHIFGTQDHQCFPKPVTLSYASSLLCLLLSHLEFLPFPSSPVEFLTFQSQLFPAPGPLSGHSFPPGGGSSSFLICIPEAQGSYWLAYLPSFLLSFPSYAHIAHVHTHIAHVCTHTQYTAHIHTQAAPSTRVHVHTHGTRAHTVHMCTHSTHAHTQHSHFQVSTCRVVARLLVSVPVLWVRPWPPSEQGPGFSF